MIDPQKIDLNKKYHFPLPSPMTVLITLSLGLLIGYLGPFGSFQLPLVSRLLYWVILIGVGHMIFSVTEKVCHRLLQGHVINPYLMILINSIVGATVLSFFVEFMTMWFFLDRLTWPSQFFDFFPKVLILSLMLNVLAHLIDHVKNTPQPEATSAPSDHAFFDRLPRTLGKELICLSMQDHYLKVHTSAGEHMILMRMSDAIRELADYPGRQVHRSWWVAIDQVQGVKKHSRKATLTMSNGTEVPVSQKYLSVLKETGLIS